MPRSVIKVKNTSRKDPFIEEEEEEEEIDDRKRARIDTGQQSSPTPSHSQGSASLENLAIPGPSNAGNDVLSTSGTITYDSSSYTITVPNNLFLGGNRFTAAQRKDLLNEPTTGIEQDLSEKLSMNPTVNEGNKKKVNSKSSKVMELRQQVEKLRNQLNKTLLEAEKAKKDRNEIVEFMQQGYRNASRDAFNSANRLKGYKKLVAEKYPNMRLETSDLCATFKITERDARLIALISIFLSVHNFGAHIDYICSYLENIIPDVSARHVEDLMRKFPNVFQEVTTGIGPNLRKTWKYLALQRP